jgi:hypothetical protein
VQVLQSVIARVKRDPGPQGGDPTAGPLAAAAPCYLALVPAGGIAAATGSGASSTFAGADCTIYLLTPSTGAISTTRKTQKVWNPSAAAIAASAVVPVVRDRYGAWWALVPGTGGGGGGGATAAFSGASVSGSSQTVSTGGPIIYANWAVEDWDVDNYWQSAAPDRMAPAAAGYFQVTANMSWSSGGGTHRDVSLVRSDGKYFGQVRSQLTTSTILLQSVTAQIKMGSTDFVRVEVVHDAGVPLNVTGLHFSIGRLGV